METNRDTRLALRRTPAFRSTNDPWNQLKFNLGWSIGLIMKVADTQLFYSFEEWEAHYFQSADKRHQLLSEKAPHIQKKLKDLRAPHTHFETYRRGLAYKDVQVNEAHGRTLPELEGLAKDLYKEVVKRGNPYNLSVQDCLTHVYIRVVDEAYIGIQREVNTIETLTQLYPHFLFGKTTADNDRKYAVDVEVFDTELRLLCGIQIKSGIFSKGKSVAMKDAQSYNLQKHARYTERFGVNAHFLHATVEGSITNPEMFAVLDAL